MLLRTNLIKAGLAVAFILLVSFAINPAAVAAPEGTSGQTPESPADGSVQAADDGLSEYLTGQSVANNVEPSQISHTVDGIEFNMSLAPAADFPTGGHFAEGEFQPVETATVKSPFWIAETEVTYELWYAVRTWAEDHGYVFENQGMEGSATGGGDFPNFNNVGKPPTAANQEPVTTISWGDALVWVNALTEYYNERNGTNDDLVYELNNTPIRNASTANINHVDIVANSNNGFRLPTSHEWELAARYQGSSSANNAIEYPEDSGSYWTPGNHASGAEGQAWPEPTDPSTDGVAVYSTEKTANVKTKAPNILGLYDMSGNVQEWCFDRNEDLRVRRGGGWYNEAFMMQLGRIFEDGRIPEHIHPNVGFRFVKDGPVLAPGPAPAISPEEVFYDLDAPLDVNTAITWNAAGEVESVYYAGTALTLDEDYMVSEDVLTVMESFIQSQSPSAGEELALSINFDQGTTATLIIKIRGLDYFSKTLLPGWNLLSVPLRLQEGKNTLGRVIQDMEMVELVYMYDSEVALEWDAAGGMVNRWAQPTAETELYTMGAMFIKVSGATEARLYPYEHLSGPYTRKLHEGWNLFGPALLLEPEHFQMEARYVLASLIHPELGNYLYSQASSIPLGAQEDWTYVPGTPDSPLMQAADGYWIYMLKEANLAGHSVTLPEDYSATSFSLQETKDPPELPAALSGTVQDEQGNPLSSGKIEIVVDGVARAAKTFNDGEFGLSLGERMLVEEYYHRTPDNISFKVNGYAAELEEDLDWSQASGSLYQVNILVDTQIAEEISFLAVSVRDSSTVELLFSGSLLEDLTAEQVEALRAAVLLKRDGQEYTALQPEDELAVRGDTIVLTLAEPLGQENRIHIEAGAITAADGELLHQPVETSVFTAKPVDECFIATAAFGSKLDPGVALLRQYRDARLLTNRPGQVFVSLYYSISPGIAAQIAGSSILKGMVRILLLPLLAGVYLLLHQWLLFMLILCTCAFIYLQKRQGRAYR